MDNLGDFLISLPLFEQIAQYYHARNKTVTIFVSSSIAEFCRDLGFIDNVIAFHNDALNAFATRVKSYRSAAKFRAEKTILFHSLGRSGEYDYMALLPNSREKYAIETMDSWPLTDALRKYRTLFLNRKYTKLFSYDISHTLSYNETELVRVALNSDIEYKLYDIAQLRPFTSNKINNTPYYLIVPGSSSPLRQWPTEKFALLIDKLADQYPHLTPVLTGGENDMETAEEVYNLCHNKKKIINLCGQTTLKELFNSIEYARFLITNDTGPYHIAPLLNTKTFCIGGSWHLGAYGPNPLYTQSIYIYADVQCKRCGECCPTAETVFSCLEQITVNGVFDIIVQNYKD